MYYVCIENNVVISTMSYEPEVPSTVSVFTITDEQHAQIMAKTHYFDIVSKQVLSIPAEIITQKQTEIANSQERAFLNSTDWKVLRHLRQKALNIPTSLSDAEYLQLEQQRQDAAARIQ